VNAVLETQERSTPQLAEVQPTLIRQFEVLANASGGVALLRELILSLAVQGKLVPQDQDDEPASALLERIHIERRRLTSEIEAERTKPSSAVADDEVPYLLPETWAWARLPMVYYSISPSSKKLPSSAVKESGRHPVVDQGQSHIAGYTDEDALLIRLPGPVVVFGDHTKNIKFIDFDFVAGADGTKILRPLLINERFFAFQLRSYRLTDRGYARHFKVLNSQLFAVAPIAEQARIVSRVDELMQLCDALEAKGRLEAHQHARLLETLLGTLTDSTTPEELAANWQRVAEHFDLLLDRPEAVDALEQTLLALAIRGRLGTVKQQDPHQSGGVNDCPFTLPTDWKWTTLADLQPEFQNGASSRGDEGGRPTTVIRLADIKDQRVSLSNTRQVPIREPDTVKYRLRDGDILITRVNGSADIVGQFNLVEGDPQAIYCDHFIRMRVRCDVLDPRYLTIFGATDVIRDRVRKLFISTAGQKTVNQGHIGSLPVAVPPLGEQVRIVARVTELRRLCADLRQRLAASQATQSRLAEALVESALA